MTEFIGFYHVSEKVIVLSVKKFLTMVIMEFVVY